MVRSWMLAAMCAGCLATHLHAQTIPKLEIRQSDYIVDNFKFRSGDTIPSLRLHYRTIGTPALDARGRVTNAVLILHGTGGDGTQFLRPQFADVLFKPRALLDPAQYFIILPDDIGHGKSSRPSDGLRARFPHYDYTDMVTAEHALVTQGLNVNHLRLVMGTSMGCMHTFLWGETYPDFMDALMPLACLPVAIAGRNRLFRAMIIDAITHDPGWKSGNYKTEPQAALRTTADILMIAGSAPLAMQQTLATRDAADKYLAETQAREVASLDANDMLYAISASRDYDPSAELATITAHLMWVNSADDFINPPELGIAEHAVQKIPHGQFVLIPARDAMHGHSTHTWAAAWQRWLAKLLKESARQ